MKISTLFQHQKPVFSFEFFPPKTEAGEIKLFETISELKVLHPDFISVTYGAMGTTRNNTLGLVDHIKSKIGIEPAAHLTCITHKKNEISDILEELQAKNI